jgi:hypothetical protein
MKKFILLASFTVLAFIVEASGQCDIDSSRPFKIKLTRTVSSATARASDYVEFTTLEDIYSVGGNDCATPQVLIPKETSVFGYVKKSKHRHFPFVNGSLEVQLEPLINWDGHPIIISVVRRTPVPNEKAPKPCKTVPTNCLAGRKNPSVAPVVAGIAAAGAAVVTAVAGSSATRIVAATGFFTLLSQSDVAQILNGADAGLDENEVFDLVIAAHQIMKPAPKKP